MLLSFLFLNACATVKHQIPNGQLQAKVLTLTDTINQLSPNVDAKEAKQLAKIAVYYPLQLAKDYQLIENPVVHNIMVNNGLRKRGLCTHWTEDLLRKLAKLNLQTLKLYWGIANQEARFRLEHSAVVVSPVELGFSDGIVLDGWRDSGVLYFSPVPDDKYQWKRHFNDVTAEIFLSE